MGLTKRYNARQYSHGLGGQKSIFPHKRDTTENPPVQPTETHKPAEAATYCAKCGLPIQAGLLSNIRHCVWCGRTFHETCHPGHAYNSPSARCDACKEEQAEKDRLEALVKKGVDTSDIYLVVSGAAGVFSIISHYSQWVFHYEELVMPFWGPLVFFSAFCLLEAIACRYDATLFAKMLTRK